MSAKFFLPVLFCASLFVQCSEEQPAKKEGFGYLDTVVWTFKNVDQTTRFHDYATVRILADVEVDTTRHITPDMLAFFKKGNVTVEDTIYSRSFPQGITLIIKADSAKRDFMIHSETAHWDRLDERFDFNGDVLIVTGGDSIFTRNMTWKQGFSREFVTEKPVKAVTQDCIIQGDGFTIEQDFTGYIIKNVTGQYFPNE